MSTWVQHVLLGVSLVFLIFLSYINWRILIITETIARTTGLFIKSLVEKAASNNNEEGIDSV